MDGVGIQHQPEGEHVFLSYSNQDMAVVKQIRAALEQAGHPIFQDRMSIKGGDEWVDSIETGLRQAYAVVMVISEHSSNNTWVRVETLLALRLRKRIVPISLIPDRIPFEILHINVIDASADLVAGIEQLLASLSAAGHSRGGSRALPVPAERNFSRDSVVGGRYPLLHHVVRLALDLVERREMGILFVAFLGSGCLLAAEDEWATRVRRAITGSTSYDSLRIFGRTAGIQELTAALRRHLDDLEPPPVYRSVADLAAAGWIRLIITTNIDTSLEKALIDAGVAASEIETLVLGNRSVPELLAVLERPLTGLRLVKLNGDIDVGIARTFGADDVGEGEWERALANILRYDTMVIAHRPGDLDLVTCLRAKGDAVWLLDPAPPPGPELSVILGARRSSEKQVETGRNGLARFLSELVHVLSASVPLERTSPTTQGTARGTSMTAAELTGPDQGRMARLAKLQDDLAHLLRRMQLDSPDQTPHPSAAESDLVDRIRFEIDALSQAGEGTILGGFRIQSKLGRGGIGSVYRAVHIFTGLSAAVKIMSRDHAADWAMRSRFFRGARIMATLHHPSIVRVLDVGGRIGQWNYYVLEYVDGPNLEVLLATDAVDESARWRIGQAIIEAIAVAHSYVEGPIVHRDIKPSNILMDTKGAIKVTDFDTAFLDDLGALTHLVTAPFGTSFYASPELDMAPTLAELRDPRVDVFALGRVLFRMFTGVPSIERLAVRYTTNPDMLRFALSGRVPGPAVSPLGLLLRRAMDYDPDQRFATAGEMLQGLVRVRDIAASASRGDLRRVDLTFVRVETGRFLMGSPPEEPGRDGSENQHRVEFSRALLASCIPVTRMAWATVWGEEPPEEAFAAVPVERVSWYDALSFCNALSLYLGFAPCYTIEDVGIGWDQTANGFRLPTEAEWEYLCRAGTTTTYYAGDSETDLARAAWYAGDCLDGPVPVAGKAPNPWGFYDMHGNVWEWCWDWLGPYPREDQVDPAGPPTGLSRVLRGGSWRRSMHHCRSATRYDSTPENRGKSLGFRVVRTIVENDELS